MSTPPQILVVDDSEEQITFISEILENNGFTFQVARNGEEALEEMSSSRPQLVLLDIMMPRKSGLNVFHQMKKKPDLESIPIIIITGASRVTGVDMITGEKTTDGSYGDDFIGGFGEILREKLKGISPDGFIEKPVEPASLVAKINEILSA